MSHMCNTYLVVRLVIGFLDISSDILLSVHLLLEDQLFWSTVVAGWVLFAFLMSIFAVILERCKSRMPMSPCQYILRCFKVHAESGEAFFGSGPQLITQLGFFWSGVQRHDIKTYLGAPSLNWASAWLGVFSIAMSFISLNVTAVRYNNEPERGARVFWSTLCSCFTSLYRVFIISIILTITPVVSAIILLCFYLSNIVLFCCLGDGCYSLSNAYFSILLPVGYNQSCNFHDDHGNHKLEKSDMNKVNHLTRITTVLTYHLIVSVIFVITYVCILEICLHNELETLPSLSVLHNRYFTYSTVLVLLIFTALYYGLYFIQARKTKNAKRNSREIEGIHQVIEDFVDTGPMGKVNYSYSASRIDRERSTSLLDPSSTDMIMMSPSLSRPCSMLYPYLSSAPAPSELGDLDSLTRQSFPGGRKCDDQNCVTCTWLREGPSFSNSVTKRKYKFMTPATCTDECLIYVVTCESCRKQFVGKAEHSLREKNKEHREDIEKQGSLLGRHFGSVCGYENWSLQIIDKCPQKELGRREQFWQEELTTLFPLGLNESVK